jgi:membrane fusion protein, multidrug efflux system
MNQSFYATVFFSIIITGVSSCKDPAGNKNTKEPPVAVTMYEVTREKAVYYDTYPATIVALKEVELRGQVSGYLTGIFFNEGSTVKQGQKLYEIDRRKYAATYEQAKNNVKIAEDNLEKVQRDVDRYTELSRQDAISKQSLDNALTDLQNVRLQVLSARSELEKANTDLEYSVITAPFDGTIGISQVKLGALINPGQTLLNIVSSDDPMGVDFVIDEKDMGRFVQLNSQVMPADDSTFRISLPDKTTYSHNGKISFIDRAVDPQTGTIKVRLIVPNNERSLRPGMSCNVKVLNQDAGIRVVIPYKAVVEQMGEYFVFRADSSKARQVRIRLGTRMGFYVIIQEGLNAGDKIIIDGIQKLHDGATVMTADQQQPAGYNK